MNHIGTLLGVGKSRKVYEYLLDTDYVVKINDESYKSYDSSYNPNQCEFKTFTLLQSYGLSELLAPCRMEGDHLLMLKTSPLPKGQYEVPIIFCDRPKNWGVVNDKLYRIDYSWNTEVIDNQLVFVKKQNEFQLEKFNVIVDKLIFDDERESVIVPLSLDVLTKLFSTTMTMIVD